MRTHVYIYICRGYRIDFVLIRVHSFFVVLLFFFFFFFSFFQVPAEVINFVLVRVHCFEKAIHFVAMISEEALVANRGETHRY
jgi:hypothetical protein